jgi:hypothetical protein
MAGISNIRVVKFHNPIFDIKYLATASSWGAEKKKINFKNVKTFQKMQN